MADTKSEIILIGPAGAGKSTLGKLLSEALGLPQASLDDLRWKYYREIGYGEALAQTIRAQGGFLALVLYWPFFDTCSIERLLSEHRDCIFDFGAGAGANESEENIARVAAAVAPYRNVILLLPSPDIEESLRILKVRGPHPPLTHNFDFNRHFLERGFHSRLAKHTVYTKDKSPKETRDEILALVGQ